MTDLANVGELDRRTYLGGSDAAAILGLDPYRTPLTCYLAKIGESDPMDADKLKFLERRKRFEEPIVAMLREEFDGAIVNVNARYRDPALPFLAAEIDFEWADADGVVQNGEIKTVSPFAFNERGGWGDAGTDEIPVHYAAQVQHGLSVTGRQSCIVAALAGLDTMVFYRVERDDETIEGMREAQVEFWSRIQSRLPPDPITMGDMARLFNRRNGRPVELDAEAAKALADLRDVRKTLKTLEADEAELALTVAKAVAKAWGVAEGEEPPADNAVLTYAGQVLGKWAAGRGSHIDQKRLFTEHPDLKAAYTVPHFFRTFRFPKGT